MGAHFCLPCLRDTYTKMVGQFMYEAVTRVYMLHLVRCTNLLDKSHVYINVRYMSMFSNINHINWAWEYVALGVLYSALGKVTIFEMRQLVGYMSLF